MLLTTRCVSMQGVVLKSGLVKWFLSVRRWCCWGGFQLGFKCEQWLRMFSQVLCVFVCIVYTTSSMVFSWTKRKAESLA